MNQVTGKQCRKNNSIDLIRMNDIDINDPAEICEAFADFFSTIGSKLAKGLKPSQNQIAKCFLSYQNIPQVFSWNPLTSQKSYPF